MPLRSLGAPHMGDPVLPFWQAEVSQRELGATKISVIVSRPLERSHIPNLECEVANAALVDPTSTMRSFMDHEALSGFKEAYALTLAAAVRASPSWPRLSRATPTVR